MRLLVLSFLSFFLLPINASADEILMRSGFKVVVSVNGAVLSEAFSDERSDILDMPLHSLYVPSIKRCVSPSGSSLSVMSQDPVALKTGLLVEVRDGIAKLTLPLHFPEGRVSEKLDDGCRKERVRYRTKNLVQTSPMRDFATEFYVPYQTSDGKSLEMLVHVSVPLR